jgi:class 3 adenylate cyclase/tetratricopeptide (TPR) repeat protein
MTDSHHEPPLPPAEQSAIDAVEQCLRQGEPLLAYNALQEGLQAFPASLRLRQLRGLAIARSGDIERANQMLRQLADEGLADAETLGMLARTHKDLALRDREASTRDGHLASAFRIYHQAYEAARREGAAADAWYTGINTATIAVLQSDLAAARLIAGEVRDVCLGALASPSAAADYWLAATLGEAALILGDHTESAAHYARAARLAAGRYGNLGSTRRQAQLLAERLPGNCEWLSEVLKIPPVMMYTGHGGDQPGRNLLRFPVALEAAVAAAIRQRLEILRPMAAYGSAVCGSDILCLEAMRKLGGETHIVLPFPPAECRRVVVDFATGGWGERFERVLASASSVTITSDHRARGSRATFEYANFIVTGMARLRAQTLQTDLRGLAIWDEKRPAGGAEAASMVNLWQSQDLVVEHVQLPDLIGNPPAPPTVSEAYLMDERPPAGFSHEIRAMLFADAVGYSGLSEDQTPHFITQFLGAVADLNARTAERPEHVETTGDGLYMVFRSVRDAGYYALSLNKLVTGTDWAAYGLPNGMNIRVALHCGPVYCGGNPITGSPLYTGPHTSRTARIEPITPPGQVYVSSAFAAVAAAMGVDGLSMHYVGRMPLAKGYGLLGLYHLNAGAESAGGPHGASGEGPPRVERGAQPVRAAGAS